MIFCIQSSVTYKVECDPYLSNVAWKIWFDSTRAVCYFRYAKTLFVTVRALLLLGSYLLSGCVTSLKFGNWVNNVEIEFCWVRMLLEYLRSWRSFISIADNNRINSTPHETVQGVKFHNENRLVLGHWCPDRTMLSSHFTCCPKWILSPEHQKLL